MKRREVLVIALLVVAAMCVPALILRSGLSDAAERRWRERPYEGTLADFQAEHMELLDGAAAILWRHADYYAGMLDEWDDEWQIYREDFQGELREPFTPQEWETLQRVVGEQMCSMAVISWWHTPHLTFYVDTTRDGRVRLMQIPQGEDEASVSALLEELKRLDWDMKKTAYPNWYAAERLT